ncbi:helix-turn-helix domain-containing protein [Streptomyces jumonjinensis]|uniref:Helix-turn-helix domain-containing protein n=1 Tax=Streptomyces jumonjinensis TaxID=1945 RepID=A0A646KNM8_STRJU|nr:helix-turn-helix transcriptional regulator [Streptomyces jumonjinensis]MQT03845.1 helix-turn-helix domain-containing protein [Streptomyces jumonjinensis]
MATSPSSSAQAAREHVAARLREIRLDAGITKRELAARAGWHESKSSRLEAARTAPSDDDIRAWCRVCGAENEAAGLIASSRHADSLYVQWKRLQSTGLKRLQVSSLPLFERTQNFKVYCSNVIPGFLQTPGYATALLRNIRAFRELPDDVADAVAARMERSRLVREGARRRLAILLEEPVLRYRIGGAGVMAGQLGGVLSAMDLPSVSLGVIPVDKDRQMWPIESFTIFDDERVDHEPLSASVKIIEPEEVAQYRKAFRCLYEQAVYGAEARALIVKAIDALN